MYSSHEILLTTANARYSHSSLGLRYLHANLGNLRSRTIILEYTIKDCHKKMVENWLKYSPKVIGIGVYIWNIELLSKAILLLKEKRPDIIIILGGPEVSYEIPNDLYKNSDYIIQLEGEEVFKTLCLKLLDGNFLQEKIIRSQVLDTKKLSFPYSYYTDDDVKNRKIYVEASRGCAFKCHFCLSSLDDGIRNFDVDLFLEEILNLYKRGVRQFKFVDRTFNLDIKLSVKILLFFLEKFESQNFFLHFEVIPDRLPQELKKHLVKFKPGVLQFEVGIQTFNKAVSTRIGRNQNKLKAIENLTYLRNKTHAHLHVDLIIGLPGACIDIFKEDLNDLIKIGLQEVQIGMLKNLKGTPLKQHISKFKLNFKASPPYEIQSNIDIEEDMMKKLRNFQKFWDKYYNSGNFPQTMNFLFSLSNPFDEFFLFSEYAFLKFKKTYGISLDDLCLILYQYLKEKINLPHAESREYILKDILRKKGRKIPAFLKDDFLGVPIVQSKASSKSLKRQESY